MMATMLIIVLTTVMIAESAYHLANPMQNPDLYHGDIVGDHTQNRNAIVSKYSRWPNGVIPYKVDPGLSSLLPTIQKAMRHIEANTCITFEEHDGSKQGSINIFAGLGCYSHWGRSGGQQQLSLGRGCEPFGTIVHELMHAVGFDHEQNRSDRDNYLVIFHQNIEKGAENQFQKLKPNQNRLITPFDYNSIMIYGEYTFSKNGYAKTMAAKEAGIRLTQTHITDPYHRPIITDPYKKSGLSPSDIERINILYECN